MKKDITLLVCAMLLSIGCKAQIMVDDFETNQFGWTETTQRGGTAIIKDGVMRLESQPQGVFGIGGGVQVTCYAPFDYNKPFTMTVDVLADKIGSWPLFGLLFDYEDDNNFIKFSFAREHVVLQRIVAGHVVANKYEDLKLSKGKGIGLQVEVEYTLNELTFRVNGVKALSYRRRLPPGEFLLGTSGIGFFAELKQKVSFDNLKIEQ